jgi:hypothetical protein
MTLIKAENAQKIEELKGDIYHAELRECLVGSLGEEQVQKIEGEIYA